MAENTDLEHSAHPPDNQSEYTVTENHKIKNFGPQLSQMQRKKFKQYFLEFLMIFLAVTLGFVAENIREHFAEKETVRLNMEMLVNGLKNDTTQINDVILRNTTRMKYLDTLLSFQGTRNLDTLASYRFGSLFFKCGQVSYFVSNKAAFEQMKSSGSIKLIKNKAVLNSIYAYDQANTIIYANGDYLKQHQNDAIQSASRFINYQKAFQESNNPTSFSPDIAYYGNDKINLILQFFNHEAANQMVLKRYYIRQLKSQQLKAAELIELVQHEYDLEK